MQSVSKTITTDQLYYRVVTKMTKAAVRIDLFVNILTSLSLGFSCGLFIFGIGSWPLLQIGMSFKIQNQNVSHFIKIYTVFTKLWVRSALMKWLLSRAKFSAYFCCYLAYAYHYIPEGVKYETVRVALDKVFSSAKIVDILISFSMKTYNMGT